MALFISTNHVNTRKMIRKVAPFATDQREWFVAYVQTPSESVNQLKPGVQRHLMANLHLAGELVAKEAIIKSKHVLNTAYDFVMLCKITLMVFGRTNRYRWQRIINPGTVDRLIVKKNIGHRHINYMP